MIIEKTIDLDLSSIDGNAFSLLGAFSKQAKREGWSKDEVDAVFDQAQAGDYDQLVSTLQDHCNPD